MAKGKGEGATIVIRREEGGDGGHHGGAWKVAYADFVTAMMAFFLLMWLLNATTEEQRRGLADYFNPTNVMGQRASGSGQPFGGRTPNETGQMASNASSVRVETGPRPVIFDLEEDDSDTPASPVERREGPKGDDEAATPARLATARASEGSGPGAGGSQADIAQASAEALREELERREREALERVAEQVREAVRDDPSLAELAKQMRVEQVPEGLRIQLMDAERQPMFALGGTAPSEKVRALLAKVAAVINRVPNAVAITGHTDATPFRAGARSNWDLSAERANATRRLLAEGGVAEARVRSVTGLAEREPLLPEDPGNAANRRVSVLLLRESPAAPARGAVP